MASKSTKSTKSKNKNVDIDDLFAGIEDGSAPAAGKPKPKTSSSSSKPSMNDADILDDLDELENLTAERPKPTSRPITPSTGAKKSMERSRTPVTSGYGVPVSRRQSGEEKKAPSVATSPAPAVFETKEENRTEQPAGAGAGGWGWGSIWSTATAAVETAQGVVKEIQQSEEGKKWVSQVQGNASLLKDLAGDVRARALPTLNNFIQTLAPPISSHEQLRIHITHDLHNYPFVDSVVYGVFDRVMQQVEGGDLLVVQRGSGSRPRSTSESGPFGGGPWWKGMEKRDLNATNGLAEGIKLAKASAESYAADFAKSAAAENASEGNPVHKSNIFLCIQPAVHSITSPNATPEKPDEETFVSFCIHLHDPVHELSFSTQSQTLPNQWLEWLDAAPPKDAPSGSWARPEAIQDILDAGGVDPREWVTEWVEESIGLSVGVVAQRYVAKRMRVGEAGEMKRIVREEGGGEEARAIGM